MGLGSSCTHYMAAVMWENTTFDTMELESLCFGTCCLCHDQQLCLLCCGLKCLSLEGCWMNQWMNEWIREFYLSLIGNTVLYKNIVAHKAWGTHKSHLSLCCLTTQLVAFQCICILSIMCPTQVCLQASHTGSLVAYNTAESPHIWCWPQCYDIHNSQSLSEPYTHTLH